MRLALSEVIDRFKGTDFYVAHNCEFESSFFAAQGIELVPGSALTNAPARLADLTATATRSCAMPSAERALPRFDTAHLAPSSCLRRGRDGRDLRGADQEGALERAGAMVRRARALHKVSFREVPRRRYDEIAASDPDYLRWIIEKSELEQASTQFKLLTETRQMMGYVCRGASRQAVHPEGVWVQVGHDGGGGFYQTASRMLLLRRDSPSATMDHQPAIHLSREGQAKGNGVPGL